MEGLRRFAAAVQLTGPLASAGRAANALLIATLALSPRVVAAQTAPDAPAQLSVDVIQGHVVKLKWAPPSPEVPDAYVLEGGIAPRHVLGSLALGSNATTAAVLLPSGVYYLRTYAVSDGQRSPASNEVRVSIGLLTPPSPPDQVGAVAVGHGATVSWRPTFEGGLADQVVLDVEGPISGTFPAGNSGRFRVDHLPDGEYTVRLRAGNSAGFSEATPPVSVRLPGLVPRVVSGPISTPGASGLPVRYEQLDAPRLSYLIAREGLGDLIASAPSEFEGVLRLKEWTSSQFPHSDPTPYPPWDAVVVLDQIRAGITGGFCAQYAQVLLQALAGLGVPARYVEIGSTSNPYAHFVIEVWSNGYNKWVVLDANYNLHFEVDGVPLSALEVHEALVTGTTNRVSVMVGANRAGLPSPGGWPLKTMEMYYYVRYQLKANHVAVPGEDPFDRFGDMVEWQDDLTTPWERSAVQSEFAKVPLTARSTRDRQVAESPINQVWLTAVATAGADIGFELSHNVHNVAYAEYRVVGAGGQVSEWRRHDESLLVWQVAPGDAGIEVRGVNLRGVPGPATTVRLAAQ